MRRGNERSECFNPPSTYSYGILWTIRGDHYSPLRSYVVECGRVNDYNCIT